MKTYPEKIRLNFLAEQAVKTVTMNTRKWILLLVLAAVLVGLAVIAAGLPQLRLNRGQYFRLPEPAERAAVYFGEGTSSEVQLRFLSVVLILTIVVYIIYIIASLFTRRGRQRLLRELIRLSLIVILFVWVNRNGEQYLSGLGPPLDTTVNFEQEALEQAPVAEFDPATPRWLSIALLAGGALVLAAMAGAAVWWWYVPDAPFKGEAASPAQKIAAEAEQAAQAIESGAEVQDVVLRTYYRMEKILAEERSLARPLAMTPSEFAEALGKNGLPQGAIQDLTRLFETVRYGGAQPDPDMQQRAVKALRAITLGMPA